MDISTDKLLKLLEKNARLSNEQLSDMLGVPAEEIAAAIDSLREENVIKGFQTIIDWEKTGSDFCVARIELKVTPKSGMGFEEIAETIAQFEEVSSVYLMSGGYDLALTVNGKTFKDIALFVSHRLAPLDSVVSTATHFVLRKYKERGIVIIDGEKDTREASF